MKNIVIFGAPGCGKGTQSERLIDKFGFYHISTGEVLRDHIARGTELGKIADTYISKGQLIPDELMLDILSNLLDSEAVAGKSIIFDGFPRTVRQAEELERILRERDRQVDTVIGLEVADEMLVERLINRGKETGRADDNLDTIKHRLEVYHNQTQPLQEFYTNNGLYKAIDGSKTVDAIADQIALEIERI
ncbi:MAG: adenylate kinase [Bacteroidales bacterium]|nr:adenylate kinase [Bacteroidales bacterium]MDE6801272.1 adenylate kinase [Muribaculaceae bacterium]MDE6831495.1 adenylate kinase [Muribaculaceae bacterium]